MAPGRVSGPLLLRQVREGDVVLVEEEEQQEDSRVLFVCSYSTASSKGEGDGDDVRFDRHVKMRIKPAEDQASSSITTPERTTTPQPASSPSPPPPPSTPTTPATPFSFKQFASALKDTANTPTRTPNASRSSLAPLITPAASSSSSKPPMQKKPLDFGKMRRVEQPASRCLVMRMPLPPGMAPAIASSVALEVSFSPAELSLATRRRIEAWFCGLVVGGEGCEIANVLDCAEFTAVVRRVVPATAHFCRIVPDTRLILECAPAIAEDASSLALLSSSSSSSTNKLCKVLNLNSGEVGGGGVVLRGPSGTGKRYAIAQWLRQSLGGSRQCEYWQASMHSPKQVSTAIAAARAHLDQQSNHAQQQQHGRRTLQPPPGVFVLLDGEAATAFSSPAQNRTLAHLLDDIARCSSRVFLAVLVVVNVNTSSSGEDGGGGGGAGRVPAMLTRPGRLDREVVFSLPGAEQRLAFAREVLAGSTTPTTAMTFVRDRCAGYSQSDILALLSRARDLDSLAALELAQEESGKRSSTSSAAASLAVQQQVGGQEEAKKALSMAVEWPFTRREELARFGLDVLFRGILLYGPAGCAKTTMVREVARRNAANAAFYALSGADVYSSGFGDAEAKVRAVFAQARATAPSILFFDEIDSLVGNRGLGSGGGGGGGDSVQSRVLSTFLNEMDGVDTSLGDTVVVIGATNCPQNLDRALLRPGRFDRVIYVGPPEPESVLRIELERMNMLSSSNCYSIIDVQALVREAEHMSGADVAGACRLAAVQALSQGREEPTQQDFTAALRLATRSCKPEVLAKYHQWSAGQN